VTGDRVVLAHLSDLVTSQLITSLVLLSGLVALLISSLLRSPGLGLIAIVPNLFPIITTFGAMGWLGIPLSVGTFPVAVVAFGIAVDDTIHFMVRYHAGKKAGLPATAAVCASLHRELRPILATSVIVATGYLVMATSPFQINRDVGILFAIASAGALVADLILTPILLNWRREKPVSDAW
jgi:predicted RND superfamily exporter protein